MPPNSHGGRRSRTGSSTRLRLTTAVSFGCWPTFISFPRDQHRLLIGCDIFFLDVPQELLAFLWQPEKHAKVLYMTDAYSFAGTPYRLRYYKPPILDGLLGDFYCLAPGVYLTEDAIGGCLKMIDDWPTGADRWDPTPDVKGTHACEQQAAAILLQPFGGQPLPVRRYSHITMHGDLAVIHTHALTDVAAVLDGETMARAKGLLAAWPEDGKEGTATFQVSVSLE